MSSFQRIKIDRNNKQTFSEQIAAQYILAIQTGTLLLGAKLPSIRDLSSQLKINKIGVIAAYNRLSDSGYIHAKTGSGFYVSYKAKRTNINPTLSSRNFSVNATPINITKLLPISFPFDEDMTHLGKMDLPKNYGIMEDLRSISRTLFSNSSQIYSYPLSQGYSPLREAIAFELEQKGMPISNSEQTLITNGALHALNIVLESFLKAGDHVLLEVPNVEIVFNSINYKRLQILPLERTPDKILLSEIKKAEIRQKKPKIMIIYSNCHNPTAGILSSIERHDLLNLANEINATIVEMDLYKGLNFDDFVPPLLSVMDGFKRTIYISSFSKIFASGIRIGYIATNELFIQKFLLSKMLNDISTSILDQQIIYEMIIRGIMKKNIQKMRETYRSKRDTLIAMLKKLSPQGSKWNHPEAGMFLWFEFPPGENLAIIEERSLEKKISIALGNFFYPNKQISNCMRINFALLEPVQTYNALETVFTIWRNASSRKWTPKK